VDLDGDSPWALALATALVILTERECAARVWESIIAGGDEFLELSC